jgi:clan AA aspartic protease
MSVHIIEWEYAMGLMHVTVALKNLGNAAATYEADFLVDTGATDSLAPGDKLRQIDVRPVGSMVYELADGTKHQYAFGLVEIRFMGEITASRVIFGPDDAEPVLGVTALESVGITVDPATRTLKRLPAVPLKSATSQSRGLVKHKVPPYA